MSSRFRLCYITDRLSLPQGECLKRIESAARAGVDLVQIREKDLATRPLAGMVRAALEAARGTKTRIVVNDRLDVALALGAHGVHLARNSMPPDAVRRVAPSPFLVGVSCHSPEEAVEAEAAGADYVLLGPIFPTPSKTLYGPSLGLEKLRQTASRVRVPVLALGGVSLERVKECREAGAAGIAAIRMFQECASLEDLATDLGRRFPA